MIDDINAFEVTAKANETIDRVLAIGKHTAKQERMATERQVRQDAGARGFLRASSALYGGLKDAGLQYTRKLAAVAGEAITTDAEVLQATLSRTLGDQLTEQRIATEREVMGVRLAGEHQRAELELDVERDVQLIDLDTDKAASLVKLDYKEQEARKNVAAMKKLERFKLLEEVETVEQVQEKDLGWRQQVQGSKLAGEYAAEGAKFVYESQVKSIVGGARLTAAGNESSARLSSARTLADKKAALSLTELTTKLGSAFDLNAAENRAVIDKARDKNREVQRIADAKYNAASTVGKARVDASRTEGRADVRAAGDIADAQYDALTTSLSTRLNNRKLIHAEKLRTLIADLGSRYQNQIDLNGAFLDEKERNRDDAIGNRKIAFNGRLDALDIANAGKFKAAKDQGEFEDGAATTKATKQLEAAGIKITAKEDSGVIERGLNEWLANQLGDYSEGAAEGRKQARIGALTDKLDNDLRLFDSENAAEVGNQGRIAGAKIGAITNEAIVELAEYTKLKATELDTEQAINDARLTDAKAVSKAQLDSLEKNNKAQAYANSKSMAATSYTRGSSLQANAKISVKRAISNADIRGWELYSQLNQKLRDLNLEAWIAQENRIQTTGENTFISDAPVEFYG